MLGVLIAAEYICFLTPSAYSVRKYMHGCTKTYTHVHICICWSTCAHKHIRIHFNEFMLIPQFQSILIGLFLLSGILYSYFSSTLRTLVLNNIQTFTHVLQPIMHQKLFQNSFTQTTTIIKPSKKGSVFIWNTSPTSLNPGWDWACTVIHSFFPPPSLWLWRSFEL